MPEQQSPGSSSSSGESTPALTVEQVIDNLNGADPGLRYYAAWWLGKYAGSQDIDLEYRSTAIDGLILALKDESDRTELGGYPLRRNAARALGKLGDQKAVAGLTQCLACEDFYVREAAAQSLGMLHDPACIPNLLALLAGGLSAAQPIPGRPHLVQPCEAIMEALGMLAPQTQWQVEAIETIQPFLSHTVERVQYAAARAMYQLTNEAAYGDRLVQALSASDINLRRVALSDLGAVGYLPAAEAIAKTAAENSFKLFSLKGLLAREVADVSSDQFHLSSSAVRVMDLMDSLL